MWVSAPRKGKKLMEMAMTYCGVSTIKIANQAEWLQGGPRRVQ
jgi:hypothetical protein